MTKMEEMVRIATKLHKIKLDLQAELNGEYGYDPPEIPEMPKLYKVTPLTRSEAATVNELILCGLQFIKDTSEKLELSDSYYNAARDVGIAVLSAYSPSQEKGKDPEIFPEFQRG